MANSPAGYMLDEVGKIVAFRVLVTSMIANRNSVKTGINAI